ncbi:hypothetical protein [Actinophytocola glycyrrhizae]|uniref:Integral membrane protein n=1 Tax=Actinophytocola glycyrrhizae TaxID=2044873 RepID=A0ABV9SC72_9PSEU
MIEILAAVLTYVALAAAVWAAVLVVVGKPIQLREWHGLWLYGVALLVEVGLLVLLVAGIVRLATEDRQVDALAYLGYLVTSLLVLPLAGFWALVERTRWGPAVLVVGCLTVPILLLRLDQVWNAHV